MSSRNAHQYRRFLRNLRRASGFLVIAIALLCAPVLGSAQQAPTYRQHPSPASPGIPTETSLWEASDYTVLHTFTGSTDGANPQAYLIRDREGNLYSTAFSGGDTSRCGGAGCGVVYELDLSGQETVLHPFTGGADGAAPTGNLLLDRAGDILGAAGNGGDTSSAFCGQTILPISTLPGCGTLFKINQAAEFNPLYTFHGPDGGPFPIGYGWLIRDHEGTLYGMTGNGGDLGDCSGFGCGVVFKLDRDGKETVLHRFSGGADGSEPFASVIKDRKGNLYGTTAFGGDLTNPPCAAVGGCGVVFKLDRHGHETVLHTFRGGADGANPAANLLLDDDGNLYGTAQYGGDINCSVPGAPMPGCGVVFKIEHHRLER